MRRVGGCLGLAVVVLAGLPAAVASAEPFIASIKTFRAVPVAVPGGGESASACAGCGAALELEYVFEGEGYAPTAGKPNGAIPPLAQVDLYLPAGMQVHAASFAQCSESTLKNSGPAGCPPGSVASPTGNVNAELPFGLSWAAEEAALQAFVSNEALLFFEDGHVPLSLEAVWDAHFVSSHEAPYEEELIALVPAQATLPGAPLGSTQSFRIRLGAVGAGTGAGTSYLTLPTTCTGGLPFKTEVTFGGEKGGEQEFQIPAKTATATFSAPCPFAPPQPPVEKPPVEQPPQPPAVTAAEISALLSEELAPAGKHAKIGALLRRGSFASVVRALEAGTLEVGWYELPRGAKLARRPKPRPVLVASGRLGFSAAGSATMTIRLSARGKRLLRHARRRLALTAKGTFTPTGQPAVVGFKRFTLRR